MKRRHREAARGIICGAMLVLYISVTSAANLFHTEFYNHRLDRSRLQDDSYLSVSGDYSSEQGNDYFSRSDAACPVCAFFKTHNSQVYHGCILVSITTPPAQDYRAAEAVFLYKQPLPALQTRAPPA